MRKKEFTRRSFMNWLKRQPKDQMIDTGIGDSCPIATYLEDKDVRNPDVDVVEIQFDIEIPYNDDEGDTRTVTWSSPKWAKKFVKAIDKLGHDSKNYQVSVRDCIDILEGKKVTRIKEEDNVE